MPIVFSPAWSPDGKYLLFSGFDFDSVDLYRYELTSRQLMRMTRDMDTESWAFYGPDGNSIYYLCETNGDIKSGCLTLINMVCRLLRQRQSAKRWDISVH